MNRDNHLPEEGKRVRNAVNGKWRPLAAPVLPPMAQHFLLDRGATKSAQTVEWYRGALASFGAYCYEQEFDWGDPKRLTATRECRMMVLGWINELRARGKSANTLNNRFRALRAYCNWLVDEEYVDKSPMVRMAAPPIPKNIPETYSVEDLAKILRLCPPNVWWGDRDRAVVLCACVAGLRREEISRLDVGDINIDQGIAVVRGKGNKQRVVALELPVLGAMLRYSRHRDKDNPAFFQTMHGRERLTPSGITQLVRRVTKAAGIQGKHLGPHRGRHTYAHQQLRAGANLKHVQAAMGHSDIKTTQVYLRGIDSEEAAKAQQKLGAFKDWRLG